MFVPLLSKLFHRFCNGRPRFFPGQGAFLNPPATPPLIVSFRWVVVAAPSDQLFCVIPDGLDRVQSSGHTDDAAFLYDVRDLETTGIEVEIALGGFSNWRDLRRLPAVSARHSRSRTRSFPNNQDSSRELLARRLAPSYACRRTPADKSPGTCFTVQIGLNALLK